MAAKYTKYQDKLEECLQDASVDISLNNAKIKSFLDCIIEHSESSKGVLAVVITSLIKKIVDPEQDVRCHQEGIPNGYSGRTLDTKVVTPFLKQNEFPAMAESGWTTRSLEHKVPYDFNYTGTIRSKKLKTAFLNILHTIQTANTNQELLLVYLLNGLIRKRDKSINLALDKPINLPISTIILYLNCHFTSDYTSRGASRLPVLAIYAAYQQMIKEVGRYKNTRLVELQPHTSADTKAGAVGDIEVVNNENDVVEAVEIKHQIPITLNLLNDAHNKFRSKPIKRYYLLTTSKDDPKNDEINEQIITISRSHGCQVIVNGVLDTLKYYLRLLKNPDDFIKNYVQLVEKETAIKYEHKEKWNKIIRYPKRMLILSK